MVEDLPDKNLVYYMRFKTLIYFLVRPLPYIYGVTVSIFKIVTFFAVKDFSSQTAMSNGLSLLTLWIGIIVAVAVYDDSQKKYLAPILAKKTSYFWPIVTPLIWMVTTIFFWFITLPLYLMYRRR